MFRFIDSLSGIIRRPSFSSKRYFLFSWHGTLNLQKWVSSCNFCHIVCCTLWSFVISFLVISRNFLDLKKNWKFSMCIEITTKRMKTTKHSLNEYNYYCFIYKQKLQLVNFFPCIIYVTNCLECKFRKFTLE